MTNQSGPEKSNQLQSPLGDRYVLKLMRQVDGLQGENKSAKTRAKIKLAAIECLSNADLSALTIAAVTSTAEVASGTFYLHFDNTRALLLEVFSEFASEDITPAVPVDEQESDPFSQIRATFFEIVDSFRRRRRLYKSLFQMKSQDSEANAIWLRLTTGWARTLADSVTENSALKMGTTYRFFLGHATSAFADEIMVRIYCDEIFGPTFVDGSRDECVAELLTFARYRLLFGTDPDPKQLKYLNENDFDFLQDGLALSQ